MPPGWNTRISSSPVRCTEATSGATRLWSQMSSPFSVPGSMPDCRILPDVGTRDDGGIFSATTESHQGGGTMSADIERRQDVNPERGEHEYGDVAFADPVNNKYPIDTPKHIRAAWSYINHPDNAAKYDKDEVEQI